MDIRYPAKYVSSPTLLINDVILVLFSDEPSDWLTVCCSASITRLQRIIQLLGAQALALGKFSNDKGCTRYLGNIPIEIILIKNNILSPNPHPRI